MRHLIFSLSMALTAMLLIGCAESRQAAERGRQEAIEHVLSLLTPEVQKQLLKEAQAWWEAVRQDDRMEDINMYGKEKLKTARSFGDPSILKVSPFGCPAIAIPHYYLGRRREFIPRLPWVVVIWIFPDDVVASEVGIQLNPQIVLTTWRREGDIKDRMSTDSL